ncbi:MAG TPA: tripartite tricarboxylate transporter substrate binding protein [Xanthobacteraceae bacterium]|nr:tripartite tricarboxylate transporter substrate binding protein [Xanthobacteraceae bacterium]
MRRIAAALAMIAVLGAAHAEPFPTRTIRLIVPYPAGGALDVMGRLAAQSLSASIGQQVIVDNRPGAGSTLAGRDVARAEPDGYTLLLGSAATLAIGPALFKDVGYDPATSFAPVAFVSSVPYVMIAGPKMADPGVKDVIADAKAHPGKLSVGVPNGAPPHMLAAWFKSLTATDILVVPYKGASTVITDLIGGQIDLGFETTSITLTHLRDGSIRPLGVATRARLAALPGVPTMIENGVADFVAASWCGIMAPAGTPPEIVEKLNAGINAGLKSAEVQARMKTLAAETRPGTPQDFAAFIAEERPKWTTMAKLSSLKPE